MNLKQAMKRRLRGHEQDVDVNLTGVMNIFLILIPFLLLTAAFVRISVLELALPTLEQADARAANTQPENIILNKLTVSEDGFELSSPQLSFRKLHKQTEYPFAALAEQLARIKLKHPESQDIIIAPVNSIRYETIIAIMDQCRESGFPNISITG